METTPSVTFAIVVAASRGAGERLARALGELGDRVPAALLSLRLGDVLVAQRLRYRVIPHDQLFKVTPTPIELIEAAAASPFQLIELPSEWTQPAVLKLDVWMTPTPTMGVLQVTVKMHRIDE